MKISPPSALSAHTIPVEQLAKNSALPEGEKIGALCQQFEAVLLRQILGNARKTVIESKLHPKSAANGIYDDMVTQQLADGLSQSGALRLADTLQHQLARQLLKADPPTPNTTEKAPK